MANTGYIVMKFNNTSKVRVVINHARTSFNIQISAIVLFLENNLQKRFFRVVPRIRIGPLQSLSDRTVTYFIDSARETFACDLMTTKSTNRSHSYKHAFHATVFLITSIIQSHVRMIRRSITCPV